MMKGQQAKLVIKPFKLQATIDLAAAERIWQDLEKAIEEIYKKNASKLSFEELYRNAYNLVIHKHGELLYESVKGKIKNSLLLNVPEISINSDDQLLVVIAEAWDSHCLSLGMIRDILMYLDRTYVNEHKKIPVYPSGLQIFREVVIYNVNIRERVQLLLLDNILMERNGQTIDRRLMKNILSMLISLNVDGINVYEEEFEKPFIETTKNYYREEVQSFLQQNTCSDFILKAQKRLAEETERANLYLSTTSESKLKFAVENEFITKNAKTLIEMENSGFEYLLNENKQKDLSNFYSLLNRVPSTLELLREFVHEYVKKHGFKAIADQEVVKDPINFVQKVLEIKIKFNDLLTNSFNSDKKLMKRINDAFDDFLNKDNKSALYLANYVDDLFKNGLRGKSQLESEIQTDQIILVFQHLRDKDLFENYYRQHFAKRLLGGLSVSDEIEESMIKKMKNECGYQFVSKLYGMIHDINNSKGTLEEFKASSSYSQLSLELKVDVLTIGYWQTNQLPDCNLPTEINKCCELFTNFFLNRHQGQKLLWQSYLGNADIKAQFPSGRKDLNVSTYQMCILMLFNNADQLTINQIQDATNIPENELKRHILSLSTPKLKILNRFSKSKVNQYIFLKYNLFDIHIT